VGCNDDKFNHHDKHDDFNTNEHPSHNNDSGTVSIQLVLSVRQTHPLSLDDDDHRPAQDLVFGFSHGVSGDLDGL
jgi:hypothetical protein